MSVSTPSRDDFAAMLEESFAKTDLAEGYVTKGIITAIEKDVAIVDVGLKVEGRIARRFDLEVSVINALPDWMVWAVPESGLGWIAALAVLASGLYMQWFARWAQRQFG